MTVVTIPSHRKALSGDLGHMYAFVRIAQGTHCYGKMVIEGSNNAQHDYQGLAVNLRVLVGAASYQIVYCYL